MQQQLPENVIMGAIAHMNDDHSNALLDYARALAGCEWATLAEMTALDATGFEMKVQGDGREETHRIAFPEPVYDGQSLRMTLVQMAQQARQPDSTDAIRRTATAHVATPNALRYMKALCNHFDRGAKAKYEGNHGSAEFPFGNCAMEATPDALVLHIEAESDTMFDRLRHVVADHLVRFGTNEELKVEWVNG